MITAGVDVGTRFLKICIVEDSELIGACCSEMDRRFDKLYRHSFRTALKLAGRDKGKKIRRRSIKKTIVTGYGAGLIKKATYRLGDHVCLARGARALDSKAQTIIDVGGFFIKVITIDSNGFAEQSHVNEKCAAGSGKFLEMMAEAVHIPFEQISSCAEQADGQFSVAGSCAVFAESSVISRVNAGENKNNVISGVIDSIVSKTTSIFKSADAGSHTVISGGMAWLPAFAMRLEKRAGLKIKDTYINPQLIAAYGAGIIAGQDSGFVKRTR